MKSGKDILMKLITIYRVLGIELKLSLFFDPYNIIKTFTVKACWSLLYRMELNKTVWSANA